MHTSVRHMGRKATRAGETLNEGAGNPVVGYQVATIKYCRIIGTRCEQVILDKSYTRLACVRCPVSEPRPIPNSRSHSNVGHQRLQSKVNQQLPSPLVCRSLQLQMTTPLLSSKSVELHLPASSHASNVGFRPSVRASTDQKARLSMSQMDQADQGA